MRRKRWETSKLHYSREEAVLRSSSSCNYILISVSICLEINDVHLTRTIKTSDYLNFLTKAIKYSK